MGSNIETKDVIDVSGNIEAAIEEIAPEAVFIIRLAGRTGADDYYGAQTIFHWWAARLRSNTPPSPLTVDTAYSLGYKNGWQSYVSSGGDKTGHFLRNGAIDLSAHPTNFVAAQDRTYERVVDNPDIEMDGMHDIHTMKVERPMVDILIGETALRTVRHAFSAEVLEHLQDPESTLDSMLEKHARVVLPPREYASFYSSVPNIPAMRSHITGV
ncbi:MAG TPA: hypothetical protein VIH90_04595 [Candidatus Saccharimonadales bacterium]